MIILQTRIAASILVILAIVALFVSVTRKKIRLQEALDWLTGAVILEIIILFPGISKLLARIMGIAETVNMVFFSGFLVLLILAFRMSLYVSNLKSQVRTLVQKTALLEKRLTDYEAKHDNNIDSETE